MAQAQIYGGNRGGTHMLRGNRGAVLGAAAVGLAAGLAANLGRKAVVQSMSAMSGDWFEALKTEHAMTMKIFDAIQATRDDQKIKRSTLLMQLKHALGKHAFEEENVVYPALRDAGDKEAADKLNHDHGYVKQHLYDLEMMAKDDPSWLGKVAEFRMLVERHVREEEDEIYPRFRTKLSEEQNARITAAMNKEGFKIA